MGYFPNNLAVANPSMCLLGYDLTKAIMPEPSATTTISILYGLLNNTAKTTMHPLLLATPSS